MTLTPGTHLTDPVTGYPMTVTSVTDTAVHCRYDFGEGKVGLVLAINGKAAGHSPRPTIWDSLSVDTLR